MGLAKMTEAAASGTLGILDADLGGAAAMAVLRGRWPQIPVVYLADTVCRPMGDRSPELIRERIGKGIAYLQDQGADWVLIASQSMAAHLDPLAPEDGRPVLINPIRLAAAEATTRSPHGRIGLIASRATLASDAYGLVIRALRPGASVQGVAAPLILALLDGGWQRKPETRMIVKKYLHRLKMRQVDTLILGGSRYGELAGVMGRKIGFRVHLVDPMASTMKALARWLGPANAENPARPAKERIAVTDLTPAVLQEIRSRIGGRALVGQVRL